MTPEEVAATLAARTPGTWTVVTMALYLGDTRLGEDEQSVDDARAIVVAVNLAEPLLRVAEAARAVAALPDSSTDLSRRLGVVRVLRDALAVLVTAMEGAMSTEPGEPYQVQEVCPECVSEPFGGELFQHKAARWAHGIACHNGLPFEDCHYGQCVENRAALATLDTTMEDLT